MISRALLRFSVPLLLLSFLPLDASAQTSLPPNTAFEVSIPNTVVSELATSATTFRASGKKTGTKFKVRTHVGELELKLRPIEIRSSKYRSERTTAKGLEADPFVVDLFEASSEKNGKLDFARLSLITNSKTKKQRVEGFLRSGGSYYQVTQTSTLAPTVLATRLSEDEMGRLIASCGVNESDPRFKSHTDLSVIKPQFRAQTLENATATFKEIQIATDADFEFVTSLGSDASANADILTTLSGVDAIYRAELGITLSVTYQHSWSVADSFSTSVTTALSDFGDYWEDHFRSVHEYDLAHLFSGRSYNNVLGVAWLGVICDAPTFSYGLSATEVGFREYNTVVTAHEMGHNLGSNHDVAGTCENIYIMCPTAGATSEFSPTSISTIDSYTAQASCLAEVEGTLPPGSDPEPDPRAEGPTLDARIRGDDVEFVVDNSESCTELEIVASSSRSRLEARTTFTLLGSLSGSAETQTVRARNLPRYKNGSGRGTTYFDLNCDGEPVDVVDSIRGSRINSSRKTKSVNNLIRRMRDQFGS